MSDLRPGPLVYAATDAVMRTDERGKFITRFTQVNPNWRGKPVAEMLERLDRVRAHGNQIETFAEDHGEDLGEEFGVRAPVVLSCAVYWAIYGYGFRVPVFWTHVYPLMQRIARQLGAEENVATPPVAASAPTDVTRAEAGGGMTEDEIAFRHALARLDLDHQLLRKLEQQAADAYERGIAFGRDVERVRLERLLRDVVVAGERVETFWTQWTEKRPVDMHGAITLLGTEIERVRAKLAEGPVVELGKAGA